MKTYTIVFLLTRDSWDYTRSWTDIVQIKSNKTGLELRQEVTKLYQKENPDKRVTLVAICEGAIKWL